MARTGEKVACVGTWLKVGESLTNRCLTNIPKMFHVRRSGFWCDASMLSEWQCCYTREFPVFVTARIGERWPKPQHAWGRATQSPGRSWWMLGKIESVLFRGVVSERCSPLHPCTHRHWVDSGWKGKLKRLRRNSSGESQRKKCWKWGPWTWLEHVMCVQETLKQIANYQ